VTEQVNERLAQYAVTPPDRRQWFQVAGALVFGMADEPREQQIARGIAYYKELHAHQQQVAAAIAELQCGNRHAG
jgi:hypothetical protein